MIDMSKDKAELPYGTLDLLILKTLDTMGALHGYSIARRIEQMSSNLRLSQGSIYPALMRLEQQGWITTKWGVSETNRKVKFYSLTRAGARQLHVEVANWEQATAIVGRILGGQGMTLRRRLARVLALVSKDRLDRELDGEVQAHLELAERDALARGLDPAEPPGARRCALRRRRADEGSPPRRSQCALAREPMQDVRYGVAGLRREPGFTIVAASVLALGIGANAAVFSLVDGVLFKPLPFPNAERIVRVWETPTPTTSNSTTTRTFEELKRRSRSFEALSAESLSTATVPVNGEPTRLNGRYVSADHFAVFGVQPLIGRTFRPEEDVAGAARVVILSHAAWQLHFGGDRGILGRDLLLDNEPHQVIGVCRRAPSIATARGHWKSRRASGGSMPLRPRSSPPARTG